MNKLVKPILGILFILAFGFEGFGQQRMRMPVRRYGPPVQGPVIRRYPPMNRGGNPGRRIEMVKENFIARQLQLLPQESRAFWPLYRQYVQDQTAIRILKRQNMSSNSPDGTVQIDKELEYETDLVNIRKHYRDEFLKILPPEKVSELYKSERAFNDEVLRQLSERNGRHAN